MTRPRNVRPLRDAWPALVYGNATRERRIRHTDGRVSHYVDVLAGEGRCRGAAVAVMAHVVDVLGPNARGGGDVGFARPNPRR
ncbi:MAG: hypothetical protein AAF447_08430 [Myxococcota bacterium]